MDATIQEVKEREAEGKKDYVLLDVREDYERSEFNIGGIHVPLGELMGAFEKPINLSHDQSIISSA